jgi:hypothetical protein
MAAGQTNYEENKMTYETEDLLELTQLNETDEAGVGNKQVEAGKPLWWQIEDLIQQTEKLACDDFQRDIEWMTKYVENNPSETMDGCRMRLTTTGLEFHEAEAWSWNKVRDSDYPAIEWDFTPGDTVGWAHDLLVRHRDEIVRWRLLLAIGLAGDELDRRDCAFIRELKNPYIRIKLVQSSTALNDSLQQLTRKRRRLAVEKRMTSMLRRFADASDRALDTTFLVLSSCGLAFVEQEIPSEPGLSIRLPPRSSTHSLVEACKGDARDAVTNLLDWAVHMDPECVPQRDAYRLREALCRRARKFERDIYPCDEVPF